VVKKRRGNASPQRIAATRRRNESPQRIAVASNEMAT
jgi:hypothetical protein